MFRNPDKNSLDRYFQAGSVAAYQHAEMVRMHYRIADALDECLEKLGHVERRTAKVVKAGRRATCEYVNEKTSPSRAMPSVITAALNARYESDSTSVSDGSYF